MVSRPQDQVIEANGLTFHYREWGDSRTKQALILLHDSAETSAAWEDAALDLAERGLKRRPDDPVCHAWRADLLKALDLCERKGNRPAAARIQAQLKELAAVSPP